MCPVTLTRAQSRQVDRLAMEEYGISGLVLMENAGRGAADVLCRLIDADQANVEGAHDTVAICCGKGNNAGDGFVIARHLDLRGVNARVLLWAEPEELTGDAPEVLGRENPVHQAFFELVDAIDGSDEIQLLDQMRIRPDDFGQEITSLWGNNKHTITPDRSHLEYLLKPRERIARSYAQYIAESSVDEVMLEQISKIRADEMYGARHWDSDSFKPIKDAYDALFRAMGWTE